MMSATLIARCWGGRTLRVTCGGQTFTVQYHPWGWDAESVSVDGVVVARRTGYRMSHGYRFRLGDSLASLRVAVPWWAETYPLSDLVFVRFELDGHPLYLEGRTPRRSLEWTLAKEAVAVIPEDQRRGPGQPTSA